MNDPKAELGRSLAGAIEAALERFLRCSFCGVSHQYAKVLVKGPPALPAIAHL